MGRLERRQAGAVSASVLGVLLLLLAVMLTVAGFSGSTVLGLGGFGGGMLLLGVAVNARVANEMIQDGRR